MPSSNKFDLTRYLTEPGPLERLDAVFFALASGLAVLVVMHPIILTRRYFVGSATDLVALHYPMRHYANTCLRQGNWPLWNPYLLGGSPFQTGAHPCSYPFDWLGLLVSTELQIWAYCLFHPWLALLGGCLLLRWLGYARLTAWMAASAYALGGTFTAHLYAGHLDLVGAVAYYPWVCWATLAATRRSGVGWSVLAGAAFAWVGLIGHYQSLHQLVTGTLLFSLSLALVGSRFSVPALSFRSPWQGGELSREAGTGRFTARVFWPERRRDLAGCLLRWALILPVAAALLAFQWLPQLQALPWFHLRTFPSGENTIPLMGWLVQLVPHLFDRTNSAFGWCYWPVWEGQGYLGVTTLLFCLMALRAPGRDRLALLLPVGWFGLLALGANTPVYNLVRSLDPTLAHFDVPSRFLVSVSFFLALLSAGGAERVAGRVPPEELRERRWFLLGLLGAGLVLWTVLFYADPQSGWWKDFLQPACRPEQWKAILARMTPEKVDSLLVVTTLRVGWSVTVLFFAVVALLRRSLPWLAAVLLLDLTAFAFPYLNIVPSAGFLPSQELVGGLQHALQWQQRFASDQGFIQPDSGAAFRLSSAGGYDTLSVRAFDRAAAIEVGVAEGDCLTRLVEVLPGPLWDVQGVALYLLPRKVDQITVPSIRARFEGLKFVQEMGREIYVYRNPRALPRAFLVGEARRSGYDPTRVFLAIHDQPESFRTRVFLDEEERVPESDGPNGEVLGLRVLPNQVDVAVDAARDGYLVLTDVYWPGWSATLDGRPVQVLRANAGLHRAIRVPPGRHQIQMRYWPEGLLSGLLVSGISLLVLGGLGVATLPRRLPGAGPAGREKTKKGKTGGPKQKV